MTRHDDSEMCCTERQGDDPRQIEIVLPRARSIVWLGIKVYLLMALGIPLVAMVVGLLGLALIAVAR